MVLACSEAVAYMRVWVLSGKWAYTWAYNEALVCSAVFACNAVLVYTAVRDETRVWQVGDGCTLEPLEEHKLLPQAEHRLQQAPVDFHTHPQHHLQPSAHLPPPWSPHLPAAPVASSSSVSWVDLVHPAGEDVVFGPSWALPSCSSHPQRAGHRRRQELATHSASSPQPSLSSAFSSSSAPLYPRPRLVPDHNHRQLLQGLPLHQPQADQPDEVLRGLLAPALRSSVTRRQLAPGEEEKPADD